MLHMQLVQKLKDTCWSCKYSDLTVFSFHPVKIITTGEGGAITTNQPKIANKLKLDENMEFKKYSK